MAIQTVKASSRYIRVTPDTGKDVGPTGSSLLEFGPAGTTQQVSTMVVQFNPGLSFAGSFVVVARTMGAAADAADTPFVPIAYKVWSLNDVAIVPPAFAADPIATAALIDVPANGKSICLAFLCTSGYCDITIWDLQGSSATA